MIVCHCNVIADTEIEAAVRAILARDPGAPLEPQWVYRELQKRGRCCGCFPQVERLVANLLASAMAGIDSDALSAESARVSTEAKDL